MEPIELYRYASCRRETPDSAAIKNSRSVTQNAIFAILTAASAIPREAATSGEAISNPTVPPHLINGRRSRWFHSLPTTERLSAAAIRSGCQSDLWRNGNIRDAFALMVPRLAKVR